MRNQIRWAALMCFPALAAGLFSAGCGPGSNPSSPVKPNPTPAYSTSAVTVVSISNSSQSNGLLGICLDGGDLWFTDYKFNPTGWDLEKYTTSGSSVTEISSFNGAATFYGFFDVKAGPDGSVYVADQGHNQVVVFDSSGTFQQVIPGLSDAAGAAVNSAGTTLYVLEAYPSNAILAYSITGATPKVFAYASAFNTGSGAGALSGPMFLALDSSNNVYVTNQISNPTCDIVKYGPGGANPVTFGSPALTAPTGIAVDASGYLLVANSDPAFIQEFNPSGNTYTAGVTFGNGQLADPQGLALDGSGDVYVANGHDSQVLEFKNIH
jgi:sugar lactone lactonase YvrE